MKIFKLFVCIALILSISLINSFAAISVSDGSAFVTKAEFAADLNNLSNRMSTLENSLDAKIDSLVSSYLSRNGIWNGEKQVKSASNISLGTGITFKSDFNDALYVLSINQKLVTLSKSGLVRMSLASTTRTVLYNTYTTSSSVQPGTGALSLYFNKAKISGMNVAQWYNASSVITRILDSNLTSWKFGDLLESRNNSNTVMSSVGRTAFKEYVYFFAEKNDSIYSSVFFIGILFGQPLNGQTYNWVLNKNTLEYDLSVY